jgi:hypothetical protein
VSRGSPQNRPADFTATFLRLIDLDEVRVWRMSRRVRILCVAMVLAMLALTAYGAFGAWKDGDAASIALLAALVIVDLVVLRLARYSFSSVTAATPDGVRIGRGRRAVTVPWPAIESCEAGHHGTMINCADGARVLAAAPQHSNVQRGQHTKTEAAYAALYIAERARMFRAANPVASAGVPAPDATDSRRADAA